MVKATNMSIYVCEVCGDRFKDPNTAVAHEKVCQRERPLRDGLIGKWVSFDCGIRSGIACDVRHADYNIGIREASSGSVYWRRPTEVYVIDESKGMEIALETVRDNVAKALAEAEDWRDSDE